LAEAFVLLINGSYHSGTGAVTITMEEYEGLMTIAVNDQTGAKVAFCIDA